MKNLFTLIFLFITLPSIAQDLDEICSAILEEYKSGNITYREVPLEAPLGFSKYILKDGEFEDAGKLPKGELIYWVVDEESLELIQQRIKILHKDSYYYIPSAWFSRNVRNFAELVENISGRRVPSTPSAARPRPPYGPPDETLTSWIAGYRTITYIYYCLRGQYRSITYARQPDGRWTVQSRHTSSGICDY
jgi:hypothetical protein